MSIEVIDLVDMGAHGKTPQERFQYAAFSRLDALLQAGTERRHALPQR